MKSGRRLLALLLSVAVMMSMLAVPGVSFAAADDGVKNDDGIDKIARQLQDRTKDAFAFRTDKSASGLRLKSDKSFPAYFDLRNVDGKRYVTPVRFQNPFGTCWGFAAIAAAESSILGSGIAEDDGYDWTNLDLSEKHLVNFHVLPIADKDDSQYGEGMYFDERYAKTVEQKFNFGGLPIYASTLFSSGTGPNLEDRALPSKTPAGIPADIYEYHGLNKEISKYLVDNVWMDYCYSDDDDWSFPEELRYTQSYVMQESYMLPAPAGEKVADDSDHSHDAETNYVYNPDGTDAIKDQLLHKRAVEIGFTADQSMPGQETEGKYISKNWAHYTYEMNYANHAVTIVGYDDNYPKENFVKDHQPPHDGAWLVKNSWGSGEVEFPNRGRGNWGIRVGQDNIPYDKDAKAESDLGTGYFWLSYYDQTLSLPEAVAFEESNVGKEYYIDQYDNMPVEEVTTAETDEPMSMSNVFTADQNQTLEQISCQTAAPGTRVEYEVLILSPGFENPYDGVPVAGGNAEFEYGGFHKIKLPQPVLIQKGQSYSVVLTEFVADDSGKEQFSMNLQIAKGEEWAKMNEEPCWVKGIVNPEESYLMFNDNWYDMADKEFLYELFGPLYMIFTYDNFPIKAYSKPASGLHMSASTNPVELDPKGKDSSDTIRINLSGAKGEMPDTTDITWEKMEGSQGIFTIQVREDNPTICMVSAVRPGTGYIKVSFPGVGTLAVRVEVSNDGGYHGPDYGLEYGEEGLLDEIYDADNNPITDYSGLSFRSEDPKIMTVTSTGVIKATGIGKTKIIVSDTIGAEGEINVYTYKAEQKLKVKGKKAKVSAAKLKKKAQTIPVKKALKIKGAVGKKTYKKVSGSSAVTVNKKNGKITVKKGTKKGTYTVNIKVSAAGNKYYKKASASATAKIVVK
ncbi:MAG: hypothetical protein IKF07_06145 [Eubacterium sp.]|nr:hypothetical protein [Eubacterium sp.]